MKIIILTNKDLASLLSLNILLTKLPNHQIMLGLSDKVGGNQTHTQNIIRLAEFEQNLIQKLSDPSQNSFVSHLCKMGSLAKIASFNKIANKHQLEIQNMNDINQPQGISLVNSFKPDLILSIRFGKILQQPIIDIPPLGVINLHSGLLPDYQGVMASFWTMLKGEKIIGTCLHFISDKKIDSGNIIQQSEIPIKQHKSYLYNVLNLYLSGCEMMISAVNQLEKTNQLNSFPQSGKATYYGFPSEKDVEKFQQLGYKLFDRQDFN